MTGARIRFAISSGLLAASVLCAPSTLRAEASGTSASGDSCWSISGQENGQHQVVAGRSLILQVDTSKESKCKNYKEAELAVASADEKVAEVVYVKPTKHIYVRGVKPGRTTVSILEKNQVMAVYDFVVSPDIESLKSKIVELFPDEKGFRLYQDKDYITIAGSVSSPNRQTQILQLADAYNPTKIVNLLEIASRIDIETKLKKVFDKEDRLVVQEENDYIILAGCVTSEQVHANVLEYIGIYGVRNIPKKGLRVSESGTWKGAGDQAAGADAQSESGRIQVGAQGQGKGSESLRYDAEAQSWEREWKVKDLITLCGKNDGAAKQVMLEVRFAEMKKSTARRLGINLAAISGSGGKLGLQMLDGLMSATVDKTGGVTLTNEGANLVYGFTEAGSNWTVFIDALKSNGLAKVLAEPNLISISGQKASFLAGGEFPYEVISANGVGRVEWKKFGVELYFTPTVLADDRIGLSVNPKVSSLGDSITVAGKISPTLLSREVDTTIELADGQSFAIAGLLQNNTRDAANKFPVLGEIPVLGALFRSTEFQKDESELIVIATPHIVKPINADEQPLPTDSFVEPNDFELFLKGSLEGKERPPKFVETPSRAKDEGGLEGDFGHIVPR